MHIPKHTQIHTVEGFLFYFIVEVIFVSGVVAYLTWLVFIRHQM